MCDFSNRTVSLELCADGDDGESSADRLLSSIGGCTSDNFFFGSNFGRTFSVASTLVDDFSGTDESKMLRCFSESFEVEATGTSLPRTADFSSAAALLSDNFFFSSNFGFSDGGGSAVGSGNLSCGENEMSFILLVAAFSALVSFDPNDSSSYNENRFNFGPSTRLMMLFFKLFQFSSVVEVRFFVVVVVGGTSTTTSLVGGFFGSSATPPMFRLVGTINLNFFGAVVAGGAVTVLLLLPLSLKLPQVSVALVVRPLVNCSRSRQADMYLSSARSRSDKSVTSFGVN